MSHPWFVFVVGGAVAGAVFVWLALETRTVVGPLSSGNRFTAMLFWIVAWGLFWSPTVIAVLRRRLTVWTVALANLWLGPTIVGWLIALLMALSGRTHQPQSLTR